GLSRELGYFWLRGLGYAKRRSPEADHGGCEFRFSPRRSELIADLVGPEALEPNQGLVQRLEVVRADAAHLLQRLELPLVEPIHDLAHLPPFLCEAHPDRPAVAG